MAFLRENRMCQRVVSPPKVKFLRVADVRALRWLGGASRAHRRPILFMKSCCTPFMLFLLAKATTYSVGVGDGVGLGVGLAVGVGVAFGPTSLQLALQVSNVVLQALRFA